jgi:hypothetical protein
MAIDYAREFSACPFCGAKAHGDTSGPYVKARMPARSPASPPHDGARPVRVVLALLHEEGCPRALPSRPSYASSSSDDIVSVASAYQVPGEFVERPFGLMRTPKKDIDPITTALAQAIRKGLDDAKMEVDPFDLASVLLGIACAAAEAIDGDLVPPVFLVGFLPELGIDEGVAISMVRLAYEHHRKYKEAVIEKERLDIEVEQAVAEAVEKQRTEN